MLFPRSIDIFFITTNFLLLRFYLILFLRLIDIVGLRSIMFGPFFLPCKRHRFSMLRSVHIYKRSGLSYEFNIWSVGFNFKQITGLNYKLLICFILFLKYKLPLGLNLKIVFKYHNVNK